MLLEGKKIKPKYKPFVLGLILFGVTDVLKIRYESVCALIGILIVTVCVFVSYFNYYRRNFCVFFFSFATILAFDENVGMLFSLFIESNGLFCAKVLPELVSAGILGLFCFLMNIKGRENIEKGFTSTGRIYLFSAILVIEILFTVGGFSFALEYVPKGRFSVFATMICCFSLFSICALVFFFLYLKRSNDKLLYMIKKEEEMNHIQKIYYETLLEKEEATRRFRHDIKNHYMSLRQMVKEGEYEQLNKYLSQLENGITDLNRGTYNTGNKLLDVFLTYYCAKVPGDTEVKVIGTAPIAIDEIHICTIFSNLLQNAVEELHRISDEQRKKYIHVSLERHGDYSAIIMINSATGKKDVENLFSTKTDEGHGYGIGNVTAVVREVAGKIELQSTESEFCVKVILLAV